MENRLPDNRLNVPLRRRMCLKQIYFYLFMFVCCFFLTHWWLLWRCGFCSAKPSGLEIIDIQYDVAIWFEMDDGFKLNSIECCSVCNLSRKIQRMCWYLIPKRQKQHNNWDKLEWLMGKYSSALFKRCSKYFQGKTRILTRKAQFFHNRFYNYLLELKEFERSD